MADLYVKATGCVVLRKAHCTVNPFRLVYRRNFLVVSLVSYLVLERRISSE